MYAAPKSGMFALPVQASSGYGMQDFHKAVAARGSSGLQVRPSYNVPRATMNWNGVPMVQYNVTGAWYPVRKQTPFANMMHGCQMDDVSAVSPSLIASGASAGTAIMPGIGTAIGALIGGAAGLFSGKAHYSPWNFLYDDYPQHIYDNEIQLNGIRNAIAAYTGAAQTPDPPMYSKKGGPQYQASMLAIVPKYVPGSESLIAAYDRKLNEAGGAYENTVKAQIAAFPQLQNQLQNLQASGRPLAPPVAPGSPTSPQAIYQPQPYQMAPAPIQPVTPYNPYAQPVPISPGNISITSPGAAPMTADIFGGAGGYMPYLLGGLGLLAVFAFGADRNEARTRTVYRRSPGTPGSTRPRRRK